MVLTIYLSIHADAGNTQVFFSPVSKWMYSVNRYRVWAMARDGNIAKNHKVLSTQMYCICRRLQTLFEHVLGQDQC